MKRFHMTIFAFAFAMIASSIAMAQQPSDQSHGIVHPVSVKSIESVKDRDVTDVDIVVVIDDGSRMTLQMNVVTARSLASLVRNLETQPKSTP